MTSWKEGRKLRRRWPTWAKAVFWIGGTLVVVGGIIFFGRLGGWGAGVMSLGGLLAVIGAYLGNKSLFDQNRNQLPPDLLMFICERLIAAATDADPDYVEEILRGWLVA